MTDIKEIIGEDYVHSANALFHFMSDAKYLLSALQRRALCSRYCNEDFTYLDIKYNDVSFDKVAVLQKCFCDIPLRNIVRWYRLLCVLIYDTMFTMFLKSLVQIYGTIIVSVIIPVYNVAPYLREALDSVIYQTYTNLEILVIDDGSTDGSGAVCDEYARRDRRIRMVHQENKGLSTARNIGLDMMTGDIVASLDSDDAFDHRMVEVMLKEMRHADIAVCGISVHKGMKRMHPKKGGNEWHTLSRTEALLEIMNGRMETAPWNKLYKKQIWEALRFPDGHGAPGERTF